MTISTGTTSGNGTTQFKTFIFWDGEECKDAEYCLFGASVGGNSPQEFPDQYIQSPRLPTHAMLELLCDVASEYPGSYHSAFSFDYDVNQILKDLSWRELIILRRTGKTKWEQYEITHIPHKIFRVKDTDRKVTVRIDDCFSFFRCRYDKALQKYGVGDKRVVESISAGKDARTDFWYKDIDYIRGYWDKEVSLGCELMGQIRTMAVNAGFHVKHWYGPGAFAAYSLAQNRADKIMAQAVTRDGGPYSVPAAVRIAALNAYAGGWFERFQIGMVT